jgi:hypothetical protein
MKERSFPASVCTASPTHHTFFCQGFLSCYRLRLRRQQLTIGTFTLKITARGRKDNNRVLSRQANWERLIRSWLNAYEVGINRVKPRDRAATMVKRKQRQVKELFREKTCQTIVVRGRNIRCVQHLLLQCCFIDTRKKRQPEQPP